MPIIQELLACILTNLEGLLHTLTVEGFKPMEQDYLEAWLHTNQQVLSSHQQMRLRCECFSSHCITSAS